MPRGVGPPLPPTTPGGPLWGLLVDPTEQPGFRQYLGRIGDFRASEHYDPVIAAALVVWSRAVGHRLGAL